MRQTFWKAASIFAATAALLLPATAQARRIQVDFDPSAFENSGGGWLFNTIELYNQAAVDAGANRSMSFDIAGSYDPDNDGSTANDVNFAFSQNDPLRVGGSD